jgi:hypothetical protein
VFGTDSTSGVIDVDSDYIWEAGGVGISATGCASTLLNTTCAIKVAFWKSAISAFVNTSLNRAIVASLIVASGCFSKYVLQASKALSNNTLSSSVTNSELKYLSYYSCLFIASKSWNAVSSNIY